MSNEDDREGAAALPVQVYIFNQTYNLRSGSDEEYVRRVAQRVDERMRQISSMAPYHDPMRVAVLAALHMADELEQSRETAQEPEDARPEEEETAASAAATAGSAPDARAGLEGASSWFESVFDSEFTGNRSSGERLSDRVSERLQTRRQERRRPIVIDADDTDGTPATDRRADAGPRDNQSRD
ncbi:MAG TPA: cell division protein ZapA [Pyrinomonadaceae bacterium]